MPHIDANGVEIYYEEQGDGAETILFAHGLLWSGQMFEQQIECLKDRYRCIAFDFRGQGRTEITQDGYDMDTLTEDVHRLIERLDCGPVHFAGLSMGGFIGMRLAIRKPELLRSLILLETTADPEENVEPYKKLNMIARWFGLGIVAKKVMPIMFGQKFLNDPARADERAMWKKRMTANHKIGITKAVDGVIYREGVYHQIDRIKCPTLIIVGDQDVATEPEKSERMHAKINGSKLVVIPGAGHSSTIEEPTGINEALEEFLSSLGES